MKVRAPRDLLAGVLFVAVGSIGLWFGKGYSFGSVVRMGPGYMPVVLSGATVLVGIAIALRAFVIHGPALEPGTMRPVVMITAAMAGFGLLISDGGMVAAAMTAVVIASLASAERRPKEVIAMALLLPAFCVVVFIWLLGQPIAIWPAW